MSRNFSQLSQGTYDLLVVGGGINGAAIANIAAASGARVAVIEKDDWASGTSSKSTKLLHGGIRYLENFEFDLVAESLRERFIQWKSAPHLVKPLRFIVPVYKNRGRPMWMMRLGVWLYDVLSGPHSLGNHEHLSVEQVRALAPGIRTEGLCGGVSYFDAQMDDARICLENVLMARQHGAHVINYVEALDYLKENGSAVGMRVRDVLSGATADIRAQKTIVAAGPWADNLRLKDVSRSRHRLRPTKGVHLVCRKPLGPDAFLLQGQKDNRVFFLIPYKGHALIGTTDTDYSGRPEDVRVDNADVEYLLTQAGAYFPSAGFSRADIISSFAGLRPLVSEEGATSKISRKHVIERLSSGVYYVMGGKYTTYRAIALECVAKVLPGFRCPARFAPYPLYGSGSPSCHTQSMADAHGVAPEVVDYLAGIYGRRCEDVLRLVQQDPSLKERICACSPAIRAQIKYAIDTEMAVTAQDIHTRRLGLENTGCPTRQCLKTIRDMCAH